MSAPILVTGAGKRLGLALAKHMLSNDIPVICTYRTMRDGIDELSKLGAIVYQCDFYENQLVRLY